MSKRRGLSLIAIALLPFATVFSETEGKGLNLGFSDAPVGQGPKEMTPGGGASPGENVRIVDKKSLPPDPFGNEENRSLMMEKTGEEAPVALFQMERGFHKGDLSFRYFSDTSGTFETATRAFCGLQGRGETALMLQSIGTRFYYINGKSNAEAFDQVLLEREGNLVVISFDLSAGTFTGSLNGEPLTRGDKRTFPLRVIPSEINEVLLRVSTNGGPAARAFFDDITMSGEPVSAVAQDVGRGELIEIQAVLPPDPTDLVAGDQRPARVYLDFKKILQEAGVSGVPDLATLRVISRKENGEEMRGASFAYGKGAEVPVRWDDASIAYEFPEVDHLDVKTGELKREIHERLGYSYNVTGDGNEGWLTWVHTKTGEGIPGRYTISFRVLPEGEKGTGSPPRAWIGDGVARFTKEAASVTGSGHTRMATADWNGDGLIDLILGENYGHILVMLNHGTPTNPRFGEQKFVLGADGLPIDAGISASPHIVDWDADGNEDLLVGTHWNRLLFYRNVGNNKERKLEYRGIVNVGGKPLELPCEPVVGRPDGAFVRDYYPTVETMDWDNDGDLDLLAGGYVTGRIFLFENTGRDDLGVPILKDRGPISSGAKVLNVRDWSAAPAIGDLNGDGLPDLVSGWFPMSAESKAGEPTLRYYVNTGKVGQPEFTERPFPFDGKFTAAALHSPRLADFNNDGLIDIAMSAGNNVCLLENIGSPKAPKFRLRSESMRPSWGNTPLPVAQFVDWNKDGLVDIITADYMVLINDGTGDPFFYKQKIPILPAGQRIAHPSGIGDDWYFPRVYDFDGDGDDDVLFGDWYGQIWWHENREGKFDLEGKLLTVESGEPIKVGPVGLDPKASFRALQGARTVFTVADFNGDGRNDLVVGDTYGVVRLFLNVGSNGFKFRESEILGDLKQRLSVDSVDWNKDSYPDIIAGAANGTVRLFLHKGKNDTTDLFEEGTTLEIPKIIQPRIITADVNGDGDTDLFLPSTRGSVLVERSFLDHGYAEPVKVEVIAPRK